ncbi:MAG: hypothetical protein ACRCXA_03755 [Peptostreptococcaceae bacterium]
MKKSLEKDLNKLYENVPPPKQSSIQETIMKVRQEVNQNQYSGLTFWEFYFQQFGFIRKKVWAMQFAILLFCGLRLHYYPESIQAISLISTISPLLFLSGITEISRTYTYGTIEIELSTKYTLSQVMMSRISILGLMDILSITILCIIVGVSTSLNTYAIFLYICVPFMITCFGCLWLLNRLKNKECNYYCFALGIFIMVGVAVSTAFFKKLYIASSIWIWIVMLVIAMIGVSLQICKLINSFNKKYDYNINFTHV